MIILQINWTKILVVSSFIILFIIILFYILSILFKIPEKIKKKFSSKHIYLILFIFPAFYLIYYHFIYDETDPNTYIISGPETITYLGRISQILIGAGIFSATSKYINSLVIFKEQFEKIIMSEKFDKLLSDKLTVLTFSNEHLSKLNNLQENWKTLTLCKYQQKFPELMTKLNRNIENELFIENNLNCYYKNFRIQVNFELLDNDFVKITELTSCTVIPKSSDKVPIEFWMSTNKDDDEKTYSKFIPKETKINGIEFNEYIDDKDLIEKTSSINDFDVKHYTFFLNGKTEYHIERKIEMVQNLKEDRLYGFASNKIIDDISVHLQYCDKLNVFFSSIGKNIFNKDNQLLNGQSYINRDVLLPGEKFNVFIYKK